MGSRGLGTQQGDEASSGHPPSKMFLPHGCQGHGGRSINSPTELLPASLLPTRLSEQTGRVWGKILSPSRDTAQQPRDRKCPFFSPFLKFADQQSLSGSLPTAGQAERRGARGACAGEAECDGIDADHRVRAGNGPKCRRPAPKWRRWGSRSFKPGRWCTPVALPAPRAPTRCPNALPARGTVPWSGTRRCAGGYCCSPINLLSLFISICDSQTFFLLLNCQFPEKPLQPANRLQNYDLVTRYNWEK